MRFDDDWTCARGRNVPGMRRQHHAVQISEELEDLHIASSMPHSTSRDADGSTHAARWQELREIEIACQAAWKPLSRPGGRCRGARLGGSNRRCCAQPAMVVRTYMGRAT
jgi:hypothetical protein